LILGKGYGQHHRCWDIVRKLETSLINCRKADEKARTILLIRSSIATDMLQPRQYQDATSWKSW
jgi:hypothetical protein